MADRDWLAERFEANRAHLRAVALRMLGSPNDADDAVQQAWLRVNRADAGEVDNVGGWLTTIVARICLDMLRSRKVRREEPLPEPAAETAAFTCRGDSAESEALLADAVGPALQIVLDRLTPAERVAFVLHDMFDLSFDEIGPIVGKSAAAARQLASRARRRVQGQPPVGERDLERHRALVSAFFAASREGNLQALLSVLAPDAVLRADQLAVDSARANIQAGRPAPPLEREITGAAAVAATLNGRAQGARVAMIDGDVGAAWIVGTPRAAFLVTCDDDRIVEIEIVTDPSRLEQMDIVTFEPPDPS
ncbi:MAG TPA: sigma-70 family RNA polymerase sigma factor [Vicinamibacterales bacterium]|nr:sigma-70 family RNA polymerase sigma factor [Vicinamibacterales bacterium]